jgi:hypothetical protein
MKKIILFSIIGILLIGIVMATGLLTKDLILNREKAEALRTIGLENYVSTDYQKDGEYQRCLKKEVCETKTIIKEDLDDEMNAVNTSYSYQNCRNIIDKCSPYFSSSEELQTWEKRQIEEIADATISRGSEKIKINEIEVRIK